MTNSLKKYFTKQASKSEDYKPVKKDDPDVDASIRIECKNGQHKIFSYFNDDCEEQFAEMLFMASNGIFNEEIFNSLEDSCLNQDNEEQFKKLYSHYILLHQTKSAYEQAVQSEKPLVNPCEVFKQ